MKLNGTVIITGKNDSYHYNDELGIIAEINARKRGHPNYFSDTKKIIENLENFGFKLVDAYFFKKRGDWGENEFEKEMPEFFYEYILYLEKIGSPVFEKIQDIKLNDEYSKTYKRTRINISGKNVGLGEDRFIIAEAGVNHNGDINIAKKLVDAAKYAGADAIKFQTFKSENLVTPYVEMAEYAEKNIGKKETHYEMLKKLELDYQSFIEIKKYCDIKEIIFLSTPHSGKEDVDFLEDLVPAYKIGSGDLNNVPILKYIAKKQKPIILSTGMATMDEIKESVETIETKETNK